VFTLIELINLFDIIPYFWYKYFAFYSQIEIFWTFLNLLNQKTNKKIFSKRNNTKNFHIKINCFLKSLIPKFYSYLKFFMLLWLCFEFLCFSFILVLPLIWWLPVLFGYETFSKGAGNFYVNFFALLRVKFNFLFYMQKYKKNFNVKKVFKPWLNLFLSSLFSIPSINILFALLRKENFFIMQTMLLRQKEL
jgi:hypothetical protein